MVEENTRTIINSETNSFIDYINNPYAFSSKSEDVFKITLDHCFPINLIASSEPHFLKDIENENKTLTEQLAISSRRANTAEIAISILHNIANVLSSVCVSVSMISDKLKQSKVVDLKQISGMLEQHQNNIEQYISSDPKGKHVIGYLKTLANDLDGDKESIFNEVCLLKSHINHIRSIISLQQNSSGSLGCFEQVNITELMEHSITLNQIAKNDFSVEVIKDFQLNEPVIVDRTRLMEIVVNLIKNSTDSILEKNVKSKQLTLLTQSVDELNFMIKVTDNGLGISPENLAKIFNYGFTTKKTGHGFGLYSCINSAKEMFGILQVESAGLGEGASFILTLPKQPKRNYGDDNATDATSINCR